MDFSLKQFPINQQVLPWLSCPNCENTLLLLNRGCEKNNSVDSFSLPYSYFKKKKNSQPSSFLFVYHR